MRGILSLPRGTWRAGNGAGKKKRERVEHTDDWHELPPLFGWPEQTRYEEIRPLVLFGGPAAGRAEEVGAAERTL